MKKTKLYLSSLVLCAIGTLSLSACNQNPKISSYYLNSSGELIAVYDNSSEENLGDWNQQIVGGLRDIAISGDGYFVINGIKTDIKATETLVGAITTVTISDDGYYVINGVKTNIRAIAVYSVSFDTGFDRTIAPQQVKDGYKVEKPDLDRDGYTLKGWYCNGEEWRFNSDVVKNDMTLKAEWDANQYTVSFVNEKGDNPADMVVDFGSNVTLPTVQSVDGYSFDGWYYGTRKVTNGPWSIPSDVTLTAKWSANEYTITIDPNGGSVSSTSAKVRYGQHYTLPVPTNSFGAFKGWYYGETKVTDESGRSLEVYTYTKNITVTTNWIEEVSTLEQFKAIGSALNGHYKLMANIDLSGEEWVPFGNATKPFTGRLDGNGFEISGLTITTQRQYEGLIGYNNGTIENVTLTDVNLSIAAVGQNSYIGGLAGYNKGTIKDSNVSGLITTNPHPSAYETYTGGIAGFNHANGSITGTTNNAPVNGVNYVGGIVASNEGALRSLQNNGTVTSAAYGAGITALSNVGVSNCVNNGAITATSYTAGIIATLPNTVTATISNCKNTGALSTQSCAGGIVGYNTDRAGASSTYLTIQKCVNTGTIYSSTTSDYIGGIAGFIYSTNISDCYSIANLTGADYAGGIIGYGWNGSISNCYAVGEFQSRSRVGGIGGIYRGTFSQCYTNVIVLKGSITGTINGLDTTGSDMTNCYYSGSKGNDPFLSVSNYMEQGTYTAVTYDSSFYLNSLFWSSSTWSFSGTTYPTLAWEQ